MCVCMHGVHARLHSRIHERIDTSGSRGPLNLERHMLVQGPVTAKLCYHTCHRQWTSNQASHCSRRTADPRAQSDRNISRWKADGQKMHDNAIGGAYG